MWKKESKEFREVGISVVERFPGDKLLGNVYVHSAVKLARDLTRVLIHQKVASWKGNGTL